MSRFAIAIVVLMWALAAAVIALRLTVPSDGAFADPRSTTISSQGIVVESWLDDPSGLHDGDLVIAVNGRSLESWSSPAPPIWRPMPEWRHGETLLYRVRRDGRDLDVPVTLGPYDGAAMVGATGSTVPVWLPMVLLGAFVFWRRQSDPAARLLFVFCCATFPAAIWGIGLQVSDFVLGGFWLYVTTHVLGFFVLVAGWLSFALRFPQNHPLLDRYPWLTRAVAIAPLPVLALAVVGSRLTTAGTLESIGQWNGLESAIGALYFVAITLSTIDNFRVSARDTVARAKAKWVLAAMLLFVALMGPGWVIPMAFGIPPFLPRELLSTVGLAFPIALAIAILRHNLFDIDLILNCALVYGPLVALLALAYFGIVVVLQQLIRPIVGEGSDLAIVGSTLAIYALLSPLRNRLQHVVDRHFYRRRYDAALTLDAFAWTIRDEVDLGQLKQKLSAIVEDTMQARGVQVAVRPPRARPT